MPRRSQVIVYDGGVPREPTDKEWSAPESTSSPYIGCKTMVVAGGLQYWCQGGTRTNHVGTHCG